MNNASTRRIIALGAITGMRSMAGAAALAVQHGGMTRRVVPLLAAVEMIADKTPAIGNRIDAAPLTARAVMGAIVGCIIAMEDNRNQLAGAALGATAAVIAAHLAYHARKSLPVSTAVGGILEDAVVVGLGSHFVTSSR
jgi:uncharacterized membrane protein